MEEEVTFTNKAGEKLSGYLHSPEGEVKAGVILAHCFSCSKHIKLTRELCHKLVQRGCLCLRFDFSGNGQSEGKFEHSHYTKQIEDFNSAVDFLISKGIKKLFAVGHSMGAAVTILAGAQNDLIQSIVSIAGISDTKEVQTLFTPEQIKEAKETGMTKVKIFGRELPMSREFIEDSEKHDMKKVLNEMHKPIFFIHGTEDTVVNIDHAEQMYSYANEPKKIEIIQGADHMFSNEEHINKVCELVDEWFQKSS